MRYLEAYTNYIINLIRSKEILALTSKLLPVLIIGSIFDVLRYAFLWLEKVVTTLIYKPLVTFSANHNDNYQELVALNLKAKRPVEDLLLAKYGWYPRNSDLCSAFHVLSEILPNQDVLVRVSKCGNFIAVIPRQLLQDYESGCALEVTFYCGDTSTAGRVFRPVMRGDTLEVAVRNLSSAIDIFEKKYLSENSSQ